MDNTLSLVYFPAAVLLGALHALEPGHAKALTASYLIGIKGTKRDSIILGLSVAATHSVVVFMIAGIGLWLGNEAFAGEATHWLERGAGVIAILIGSWMLYRRLFMGRRGVVQPGQIDDHHHHAPEPAQISGARLRGTVEIIDTPIGERVRFTSSIVLDAAELLVEIKRQGEVEILHLEKSPENGLIYLSAEVPAEPHEFQANLTYKSFESVEFQMHEPDDHHHHEESHHAHMDDEEHARAHAATLPNYVKEGVRPSTLQIVGFGAAGGMIPCPASITVMLLALSSGRAAMGVFTVFGFSLGLALALVGVGVAIVTGLSKMSETGRLSWVTKRAPAISAGLVIASGCAALVIAH